MHDLWLHNTVNQRIKLALKINPAPNMRSFLKTRRRGSVSTFSLKDMSKKSQVEKRRIRRENCLAAAEASRLNNKEKCRAQQPFSL